MENTLRHFRGNKQNKQNVTDLSKDHYIRIAHAIKDSTADIFTDLEWLPTRFTRSTLNPGTFYAISIKITLIVAINTLFNSDFIHIFLLKYLMASA